MTDVHAYREAIADDCVIGACSMNNCLYPSCRGSGLQAEHARLLSVGWRLDPDGCYRMGGKDGTR